MKKSIYTYEYKKFITPIVILFCCCLLLFKIAVTMTYHTSYTEEYHATYDRFITLHQEDTLEQYVSDTGLVSLSAIETLVYSDILKRINDIEIHQNIKEHAVAKSTLVFDMPSDFERYMELYAEFPNPQLINPICWDLLKELQFINYLPILLIILFSNIITYEKESDMLSLIKSSALYYRKVLGIKIKLALSVAVFVFHIFFFMDLALSGVITSLFEYVGEAVDIFPRVLVDISSLDFIVQLYITSLLFTVFFTVLIVALSYIANHAFSSVLFISMIYTICLSSSFVFIQTQNILSFLTGNIMNLFHKTSLIKIGPNAYIYYYVIYDVLYVVLSIAILLMIFNRKDVTYD